MLITPAPHHSPPHQGSWSEEPHSTTLTLDPSILPRQEVPATQLKTRMADSLQALPLTAPRPGPDHWL